MYVITTMPWQCSCVCHSRARVWRARGGSCRPERSEGTTAAPRPFTEFTLSEAEGFRAAASGRPESSAWRGKRIGVLHAATSGTGFQPVGLTGWKPVPLRMTEQANPQDVILGTCILFAYSFVWVCSQERGEEERMQGRCRITAAIAV